MRILFFIQTLCLPILLFGQPYSERERQVIDSLNLIISNPNSHDTSVVHAYLDLSEALYNSNIDTVIPLCEQLYSFIFFCKTRLAI